MSLKDKLEETLNAQGEAFFCFAGDLIISECYNLCQQVSSCSYYKDRIKTEGFEQVFVKLIEQVGGEGEGETYFYVLEFTEGDEKVLVQLNAYYSSYIGADYQNWCFVKPVEVVVTRYVRA